MSLLVLLLLATPCYPPSRVPTPGADLQSVSKRLAGDEGTVVLPALARRIEHLRRRLGDVGTSLSATGARLSRVQASVQGSSGGGRARGSTAGHGHEPALSGAPPAATAAAAAKPSTAAASTAAAVAPAPPTDTPAAPLPSAAPPAASS